MPYYRTLIKIKIFNKKCEIKSFSAFFDEYFFSKSEKNNKKI